MSWQAVTEFQKSSVKGLMSSLLATYDAADDASHDPRNASLLLPRMSALIRNYNALLVILQVVLPRTTWRYGQPPALPEFYPTERLNNQRTWYFTAVIAYFVHTSFTTSPIIEDIVRDMKSAFWRNEHFPFRDVRRALTEQLKLAVSEQICIGQGDWTDDTVTTTLSLYRSWVAEHNGRRAIGGGAVGKRGEGSDKENEGDTGPPTKRQKSGKKDPIKAPSLATISIDVTVSAPALLRNSDLRESVLTAIALSKAQIDSKLLKDFNIRTS